MQTPFTKSADQINKQLSSVYIPAKARLPRLMLRIGRSPICPRSGQAPSRSQRFRRAPTSFFTITRWTTFQLLASSSMRRIRITPPNETNYNETNTNLPIVGTNHLCRCRPGTRSKEHRDAERYSGASVAATRAWTCCRTKGVRRHHLEGKLLCRGQARSWRVATPPE